jgi:integrase
VLPTSTGRKHSPSNLRRDVLRRAVETANAELAKAGIATIGPITFHSLRRTYASLRAACGDDLRYTSEQIGHEDVRFTMSVYARATKRRDRLSGPHRKAHDRAMEWARMGTNADAEPLTVPKEATKSPV